MENKAKHRRQTELLPLRLEGVDYNLGGKPVLEAVSLALPASGVAVVLGANGAGKTSLLHLLHGLARPSGGQILLADGRPMEQGPPLALWQGLVFQRPVLFRSSVMHNVELALPHVGRTARKAAALAALERVGLAAQAGQMARSLSGGEQQRLALAQALARRPRLLLLDEPAANLDPSATAQVEAVMAQAAQEGCTVVLATHNLGQAMRLAQQVIFLEGGRLAEQTPAAQFFKQPVSAAGRAFLLGEAPWGVAGQTTGSLHD